MRIFVSADVAGIAGVVREEDTDPSSPARAATRRLLAGEVNAAIEGALEAGVQEIVVGGGMDVPAEDLHPRAELVSGTSRRLSLAEGIGPGFDAAFLVGYPASAGTPDAVLDRTCAAPDLVREVRLGGRRQSDGSLTGAVCGTFDCPVALFTGDAAAVSEMHEFVLEVEGVVVKEGLGRRAARSLHPQTARERIRVGARRAVERLANVPVLRLPGAAELEVDLGTTEMADSCERVPAVRRLGPRTVGYASADLVEVYRLLMAFADLARAAR